MRSLFFLHVGFTFKYFLGFFPIATPCRAQHVTHHVCHRCHFRSGGVGINCFLFGDIGISCFLLNGIGINCSLFGDIASAASSWMASASGDLSSVKATMASASAGCSSVKATVASASTDCSSVLFPQFFSPVLFSKNRAISSGSSFDSSFIWTPRKELPSLNFSLLNCPKLSPWLSSLFLKFLLLSASLSVFLSFLLILQSPETLSFPLYFFLLELPEGSSFVRFQLSLFSKFLPAWNSSAFSSLFNNISANIHLPPNLSPSSLLIT